MFSLVPIAYAAEFAGDCLGGSIQGSGVGATQDAASVPTIQGIVCLIENIITPLPALIILAAVIMLIMAGVKIMSAGADPKAFAAAMASLTWAIVGIVLLSAIYILIVFVKKFTGADVTNFGFP